MYMLSRLKFDLAGGGNNECSGGGIICKQFVSYTVILSIRKILLTLWYQFNKTAETTTHCGLPSY